MHGSTCSFSVASIVSTGVCPFFCKLRSSLLYGFAHACLLLRCTDLPIYTDLLCFLFLLFIFIAQNPKLLHYFILLFVYMIATLRMLLVCLLAPALHTTLCYCC
jgi:hypothetical protein